jgi:hypothetical protein
MLRNRLFSGVLVCAFFLLTLPIAKAQDQKLVYVIQLASVLQFGVVANTITIPFEARFAGIPRDELNKRDNWTIEIAGSAVPNDQAKVRVEALPGPRFIRFEVKEFASTLSAAKIRLIYTGTTPNIVVDTIPKFSLLHVLFAHTAPSDDVLTNRENWIIRLVNIEEGKFVDQFPPELVTIVPGNQLPNEADLKVNQQLDPSKIQITVRFQLPNFSEAVINGPKKIKARKTFTAAKGKPDADIYFSGSAAGAKGTKPLYLFESKLGYLFSLKNKGGALGPRAEITAASESNIDPDSIKTALAYEKIFVLGRAKGFILRSDALGLEFDKKNRNRNLMTDLNGTFVPPPKPIGESSFVAFDFMGGFEAGHNYRHKLNQNEGLGNLWRWKFGANAYFIALNPPVFKRIDFSTEYKVRLPQTSEPFTQTINDKDITTLEKKPRHYVGSNLDLMFSDALGVSLKYQYGSLPPAFKFVNHTASVGLTFKLKQANK